MPSTRANESNKRNTGIKVAGPPLRSSVTKNKNGKTKRNDVETTALLEAAKNPSSVREMNRLHIDMAGPNQRLIVEPHSEAHNRQNPNLMNISGSSAGHHVSAQSTQQNSHSDLKRFGLDSDLVNHHPKNNTRRPGQIKKEEMSNIGQEGAVVPDIPRDSVIRHHAAPSSSSTLQKDSEVDSALKRLGLESDLVNHYPMNKTRRPRKDEEMSDIDQVRAVVPGIVRNSAVMHHAAPSSSSTQHGFSDMDLALKQVSLASESIKTLAERMCSQGRSAGSAPVRSVPSQHTIDEDIRTHQSHQGDSNCLAGTIRSSNNVIANTRSILATNHNSRTSIAPQTPSQNMPSGLAEESRRVTEREAFVHQTAILSPPKQQRLRPSVSHSGAVKHRAYDVLFIEEVLQKVEVHEKERAEKQEKNLYVPLLTTNAENVAIKAINLGRCHRSILRYFTSVKNNANRIFVEIAKINARRITALGASRNIIDWVEKLESKYSKLEIALALNSEDDVVLTKEDLSLLLHVVKYALPDNDWSDIYDNKRKANGGS